VNTAVKHPIHRSFAEYVRGQMTPEQMREAEDERKNVFLALDLDDPDVLCAIAEQMHVVGATDIDSFIKGYEAGLRASGAIAGQ
jgi:hypothetical protein